jgi:hypothetical protein
MEKFKPGDFDTVLCLGFFYHTVRQVELLREFRRLRAKVIIVDTYVAKVPRILRILKRISGTKVYEDWIGPGGFLGIASLLEGQYLLYRVVNNDPENTFRSTDSRRIAAFPTREVLATLFEAYGYEFEQIAWDTQKVGDWSGLRDYLAGIRTSYILRPGSR